MRMDIRVKLFSAFGAGLILWGIVGAVGVSPNSTT